LSPNVSHLGSNILLSEGKEPRERGMKVKETKGRRKREEKMQQNVTL
jgi:hypothetical protein